MEVRCGKCFGCKMEHSRQWSIRMTHECAMHEANSFLTLTYNDENLPPNSTLVLADFQKFMKRLRKRTGENIRFYHCGEYGSNTGRPHVHVILFGYDFPDKYEFMRRGNHPTYRSDLLESLWPFGFSEIGTVTWDSIAYCAGYVTKKQTDDTRANKQTGELRIPEYATMSRRPAIGRKWFEKWWHDVYPSDTIVIQGKAMRPPTYYDVLLQSWAPDMWELVRDTRRAKTDRENQTPERMAIRKAVAQARYGLTDTRHESL